MPSPPNGPHLSEISVRDRSLRPLTFRGVLHDSGALLCGLVYLAVTGFLIFAITGMTGGHFVYTLDDPYIHLALAERIRSGLYGINAGEFASPSSSIVWPLLFVPFAGRPLLAYLPLLFNLVFGMATVWMLALCVRRCFSPEDASGLRRVRLLVLLLVFSLNLPGLTLTGMEHVLQLLLSLCCVYAVLCILDDEGVPLWTLAAAAALPSVRYEGALLTVAVAIALCGARRFRSAGLLVGCGAIVPIAFSVFLLHLHLPAFPLSVLLKSRAALPPGLVATGVHLVIDTLRNPERAPELILTVVLACLAYRNRGEGRIFACAIAGAFAAVVQTVAGPNGWFFRYEIAALAFTLLLAIAVDARTPSNSIEPTVGQKDPQPSGALLVIVAGLAAVYMQPLFATPAAALGIYQQQYQLSRLTHEFYTGPVAVNDLGLVSFNRTPKQYVLDLYGLGSYESARTKPSDRTPAWLDAITREHGIGLVAIYPEWFVHGVPVTWKPVGKLCSPQASVSSVSRRVMLYDTGLVNSVEVEKEIEQFADTLPRSVTLEVHPVNSYNTCAEN